MRRRHAAARSAAGAAPFYAFQIVYNKFKLLLIKYAKN